MLRCVRCGFETQQLRPERLCLKCRDSSSFHRTRGGIAELGGGIAAILFSIYPVFYGISLIGSGAFILFRGIPTTSGTLQASLLVVGASLVALSGILTAWSARKK